MLPGDITGSSIYDQKRGVFEFQAGPVFTNVLLADEINRTPPKTQAALLEAMEERQVTVDGTTYELEAPFMVVATQNPIEMEGTYPLPEAQRDRFTARVSMGYPSPEAELEMLDTHGGPAALDDLEPVTDAQAVRKLIDVVRSVHVSDEVKRYVVDLVGATRKAPELRLGASPRAALQLLRASRAAASLAGRDYVLPDDVQGLAVSVLAHRLLPTAEAQVARRTTEAVVADLVARLPLPDAGR
jgi:MoxR-like ATPase